MSVSLLQRQILAYCGCDDEPFFALIKSIQPESVTGFLEAIEDLINRGLLVWSRWDGNWRGDRLDLQVLRAYVAARRSAGEDLSEPPETIEEYAFRNTEAGNRLLVSRGGGHQREGNG